MSRCIFFGFWPKYVVFFSAHLHKNYDILRKNHRDNAVQNFIFYMFGPYALNSYDAQFLRYDGKFRKYTYYKCHYVIITKGFMRTFDMLKKLQRGIHTLIFSFLLIFSCHFPIFNGLLWM